MNDKDRKIRNLICVVLTCLCLTGLTLFLSYFYSSKNGAIHRERYYRQKEAVDVLFAGTSHAYGAYFPMTLYEDFGISAFNLATAGERFAVTYYSIKDAFRYHVPKILVLDCHAFEYGNEKNDPEVPTRCHGVFDGFRMGPVKVEAIKDVLSDHPETWNEYFFPLYYYHNRWNALERQDFEDPVKNCYGKGGRNICGVAGIEAVIPAHVDESDYTAADDYSTQYAEKIVELCRDKGVDVYFMNIPFPCDEDTQRVLNRAYPLAQKYDNCEYINLMNHVEEMDFDYVTDMADLTSHANLSGGIKVSHFIGEYLSERYDLTDHRTEGGVWDKDYVWYTQYLDRLRKENPVSCFEYLSMLYSPDYSYAVYVKDMSVSDKDGLIKRLVRDDMEVSSAQETGSYFCSNLSGEVTEQRDLSIAETGLPEDILDQVLPEAQVVIAVRNNVTGDLVEVANWTDQGRL